MTESSVQSFPVLPLRDIVVFPHMIVPLFVGREKSVRALEAVMKDVSGDTTHNFKASSTSGASGSDTGVAGSFALNVSQALTEAAVESKRFRLRDEPEWLPRLGELKMSDVPTASAANP